MAIDLEAIRKRVQELSGQRKNSSVQLWKPEAGEYKVRGIPWKSTPDGMPFVERRFYYIGGSQGILAPNQFGKPDPINDLIRKLYQSGSPDDRNMAKSLQPKMRAYMAVIVRGQEDKGVQVWSFGKMVYQRLLGFFTDEEVGDILDPLEGFDLKVTMAMSPKKVDGRSFLDTTIDAARRPSKLSEDSELAQKWLGSVPNIDDMYRQKTSEEISQVLNTWLASGSTVETSHDEGTARGAERPKDELDKLVDEVKAEVKSEVKSTSKVDEVKVARKAKKAADLDEVDSTPKKSLDDAFEDLMKDDD
jgi:hypothetical protein